MKKQKIAGVASGYAVPRKSVNGIKTERQEDRRQPASPLRLLRRAPFESLPSTLLRVRDRVYDRVFDRASG